MPTNLWHHKAYETINSICTSCSNVAINLLIVHGFKIGLYVGVLRHNETINKVHEIDAFVWNLAIFFSSSDKHTLLRKSDFQTVYKHSPSLSPQICLARIIKRTLTRVSLNHSLKIQTWTNSPKNKTSQCQREVTMYIYTLSKIYIIAGFFNVQE